MISQLESGLTFTIIYSKSPRWVGSPHFWSPGFQAELAAALREQEQVQMGRK